MFIFVILSAISNLYAGGDSGIVMAAASTCWTCVSEYKDGMGAEIEPKMCGLKLKGKDNICCTRTVALGWKDKNYCNSEYSTCTKPKNEAGALWYTYCKGVLDEANVKKCGGQQVLTPLPEP